MTAVDSAPERFPPNSARIRSMMLTREAYVARRPHALIAQQTQRGTTQGSTCPSPSAALSHPATSPMTITPRVLARLAMRAAGRPSAGEGGSCGLCQPLVVSSGDEPHSAFSAQSLRRPDVRPCPCWGRSGKSEATPAHALAPGTVDSGGDRARYEPSVVRAGRLETGTRSFEARCRRPTSYRPRGLGAPAG